MQLIAIVTKVASYAVLLYTCCHQAPVLFLAGVGTILQVCNIIFVKICKLALERAVATMLKAWCLLLSNSCHSIVKLSGLNTSTTLHAL